MTRAEKKPKPRAPKIYLLERDTGFLSPEPGKVKPKETAFGGHSRHLRQEMQSCWRDV